MFHRFSASSFPCPALVAACVLLFPSASRADDGSPNIVGGDDANACDFPSTVFLRDRDGKDGRLGTDDDSSYGCTAVLVHPRLVVTAAHCVRRDWELQVAYFGESFDLEADDPQAPVEILLDSCVRHPDFVPQTVADSDVGFCILSEDAPDVPIAPPLMGCESEILSPGRELTVAGYGFNVDAEVSTGLGTKRWTTQTIQPLEYLENNLVVVGNGGNSICGGDSGGPAFVRFPDETWRVAGIASTVHPSAGVGCGFGAVYEILHTLVPWIEAESGFDITPCHDADGTWNPTAECGGFPTELLGKGADWGDACGGVSRGGFSETCGIPWVPPEGTGTSGSEGGDGESSGETGMSGTVGGGDETTSGGAPVGTGSTGLIDGTSGSGDGGADGAEAGGGGCTTGGRSGSALWLFVFGLFWLRRSKT